MSLINIKNIFKKDCNTYYNKNKYQQYLKCLNNKDLYLKNFDTKIYVIYNNIDVYVKISDILLNHDYEKYIEYDTYTYKKVRKHIYLSEWFIVDEYIVINKIDMIKSLIDNVIKIIDICTILKENNSNRINNFNSNILQQYIINVVDILNMSVTTMV